MCEYCEKRREIKSCNFCGREKAMIVGDEIDIWGDEKKISLFKNIYQPAFKINFCPMCGRELSNCENDKHTSTYEILQTYKKIPSPKMSLEDFIYCIKYAIKSKEE